MGQGAQMQFSNDNSTWSTAEAYANTKSWSLPSGDGQKTVYVKFSDVAGNWSETVSDQITLDTTRPTTPVVTDDGATTTSLDQLHARWSSSDVGSGIGIYQYRITQDSTTGAVIIDWTSVGTATEVTKTGLTLTIDKSYYFSVRAQDNASWYSEGGYSDGIEVVTADDTTPPQVSLTSPSAGTILSGAVNINATATDDVEVARVDFYIDETLVLSNTTLPYAYTWDTTASSNGSHTIKAIAYDTSSNENNHQIDVTVNNQGSAAKLPIVWAFATTSTGSNDAFKSIDNNLSTYWQGGQGAGYWWIGFNLESSQPLSKISVSWDKDSGSTEYYILGSNDNTNFTPLAGPFSSVGASSNPQRKEHAISGTYRYVSIEIPKAQNNQYPIIYEVEIYGGTSEDTTPPVGIIKINNDDNYTGSVNVTLNLQAEDEEGGSGLDKMQFSNDNINWSAPEGYADVKDWELFSGDGEKAVYVKYSDVAGNWSEVYQDSIILDTVPPQISSVAPEDGSFGVDGAVVSLYVDVDDNGLAPVEYQYSIDGQIVQSWRTVPFYHWNAQGEGIHRLKFEVRDAYTSEVDSREIEIYLAKEPIQPPN